MKTYTPEELAEIIKKHRKWLDGEDGGECADLSDTDLRGADLERANLSCADLSCADLSCADLERANLKRANLRDANLRDANLRRANLYDTDLSSADLKGADLSQLATIWGVSGNGREIKDIQCHLLWPVTYTADRMQIGCQFHTLKKWWAFTEEEIQQMDYRALDWWKVWKPILKKIIKKSPAVSS